MKRAAPFVLLAVLSSSTGCWTMVNMANEREAYGGLRFDAGFGEGCLVNGGSRIISRVPDKFPPEATIALGVWAFLDLPFSAVADTVTLPVTIPAVLQGAKEESSGPDQRHGIGRVQEIDPGNFRAGLTPIDQGPMGQGALTALTPAAAAAG